MSKYTLVDAQQKQLENHRTFFAPLQPELDEIRKGDFVKVCAEGKIEEPTGERFWIEVQKVKGNLITGIINNDLVFTNEHGLKCDDVITFEKKNVYNIMLENR